MSNRRRIRPVRDDDVLCCQYGGIADLRDPAAVEEAKRLSHDIVLQQAGAPPRGPVEWRIFAVTCGHELDHAVKLLDAGSDLVEAEPGTREGLIEYLRASIPHGGLIIASVVVTQPPSRIGLS